MLPGLRNVSKEAFARIRVSFSQEESTILFVPSRAKKSYDDFTSQKKKTIICEINIVYSTAILRSSLFTAKIYLSF